MDINLIKQWFYIFSMSLPRIIALFTLFPLMNKRSLGGGLIRNGIAAALVLFLHPLLSELAGNELDFNIYQTFGLVIKELIVGAFMGFCFAIPFWGLEAAGSFIDNQRGASIASMMNPFSGAETSPTGILFSQAIIAVVVVTGVFLFLLEIIFKSYISWPVFSFIPNFELGNSIFFLEQFDLIVKIAMWLASPVIISMFLAEFGVAIISRSAPQLNVFILAMPIKSAIAVAVLSVYVGIMLKLSRQQILDLNHTIDILGAALQ